MAIMASSKVIGANSQVQKEQTARRNQQEEQTARRNKQLYRRRSKQPGAANSQEQIANSQEDGANSQQEKQTH